MRREEMNERVSEELRHIPRSRSDWENVSAQRELRMVFNMIRRSDLGRDPRTPRSTSFWASVASVRERHPSFVPAGDISFFTDQLAPGAAAERATC